MKRNKLSELIKFHKIINNCWDLIELKLIFENNSHYYCSICGGIGNTVGKVIHADDCIIIKILEALADVEEFTTKEKEDDSNFEN